jgi:hypothetical protein
MLLLVRENMSPLCISKRSFFFSVPNVGVAKVFVFYSHGASRLSSVFTVKTEKLLLKRLF